MWKKDNPYMKRYTYDLIVYFFLMVGSAFFNILTDQKLQIPFELLFFGVIFNFCSCLVFAFHCISFWDFLKRNEKKLSSKNGFIHKLKKFFEYIFSNIFSLFFVVLGVLFSLTIFFVTTIYVVFN